MHQRNIAAERAIRDQAATVLSHIATRRSHPSYGYTKGVLRADIAHLEGMIGLYMVLTEQANSPTVSHLAEFSDDDTTDRVARARHECRKELEKR